MYAQLNKINIYYEVIGKGQPLVMVHGNGETHEIFLQAAEILKDYFTVYLIDSRGHGLSDKVKEYHYQDMADDIKEFAKKLDICNAVYYGFSDGGIIGILLASQTDIFKKYIVSGTNVNSDGINSFFKLVWKIQYIFKKSPLLKLMLTEPDITKSELNKIHTEVILTAGEKDLIPRSHTEFIHNNIPCSRVEIIKGHTHGSYIVHNKQIADIILKYTGKN